MKIGILGGTGFLGQNLYQYLRREQPDLDIYIASRRTGVDVRNYVQAEEFVRGKDLVYNLAAQSHVTFSLFGNLEENRLFMETNGIGAHNVLKACSKHRVKLIHVSTSEVYGTNQNPGKPMTEDHPILAQAGVYATSKAFADLTCRMEYLTFGADVVIVRPFNMVGPYQSLEKLIPRFQALATLNEPITIYGDGNQLRDYVYVRDVCKALWLAKDFPAGTTVNVASGKSYSVRHIATAIKAVLKSKSPIQYFDPRPGEVRELLGSSDRLEKLTGWRPETSFEDALATTLNWNRSNGVIMEPKLLGYN